MYVCTPVFLVHICNSIFVYVNILFNLALKFEIKWLRKFIVLVYNHII